VRFNENFAETIPTTKAIDTIDEIQDDRDPVKNVPSIMTTAQIKENVLDRQGQLLRAPYRTLSAKIGNVSITSEE
jgi:hypothetical protein